MVYFIILLLGLALGSFVNAFAWRIYKQSTVMKAKKIAKYSITRGRSMCPECEHSLSVADLIPVFSWILLKGRCRYCKKKISIQYPAVELFFVIAALVSFHYWPLELTQFSGYFVFGLWLSLLVVGFCMSIIDIKSQLLPTKLVFIFGGISGLLVVTNALINRDLSLLINSLIGSVVLFGTFWSVYQVSGGKWIGGGDVRLLGVMGILLGWKKGLLAVVFASYLATIFVVVLVVFNKYKKGIRISFGPFLLLGTYVAFIFGDLLIGAYKSFSGL